MKAVVAGGSGFIGAAISRELLDAGHDVAVLTRNAGAARARVDPRAELVEWDARSGGAWERAVEGAGGIINLTGEPIAARRWTPERKQSLRASRVASTEAIVRAMADARVSPAVLINASGTGYYGARGDEPLGEDAPPGRDFLATLNHERETAAQAAEAFGVRVVLMRVGPVLGHGGQVLEKMLPRFRCFLGGPVGDGRQWWPWIHRDDVAGLFRFALEHDAAHGPINAAAPEPVTLAEFCRTLGRVLGRPSWLPVPAPLLRLALGELAEMLLTGQRAEPRAALRLGYRFQHPHLEPALRSILGPLLPSPRQPGSRDAL